MKRFEERRIYAGPFWLGLLLGLRVSAFGFDIPREEAVKHADEAIARVRQNMDTDSSSLEFDLIDSLAQPLGDDPRVIRLCGEVAQKSRNPRTLEIVITAIQAIHDRYPEVKQSQLAQVLRSIGKTPEKRIRLESLQALASLGEPYRKEALDVFKHMLKVPADQKIVFEHMVRGFGNESIVVEHFLESVRKSSGTASTDEALKALRGIILNHFKDAPETPLKEKIAQVLRDTMRNGSSESQLDAAYYLAEMGPVYSKEAREFYEKRLRLSFGSGPEAEAAKWIAVYRILRPLIESANPQDIRLLRDAAKANGLLDWYQKSIEKESPESSGYNQRALNRWRELVGS